MKKLLLLSCVSVSLTAVQAISSDSSFNKEATQREMDQFIKEYPDIAGKVTKDKVVTAIQKLIPGKDIATTRREILTFIMQFLNQEPAYTQDIALAIAKYKPYIIANDIKNLITFAQFMPKKYINMPSVITALKDPKFQQDFQTIINNNQSLFDAIKKSYKAVAALGKTDEEIYNNPTRKKEINTIKELLNGNKVYVDVVNRVDVNPTTTYYGTPLAYATLLKATDIMQILIDHGANVNAITVDRDGVQLTPLAIAFLAILGAIDELDEQNIRLLLHNRANTNAEVMGQKLSAVLKEHGINTKE